MPTAPDRYPLHDTSDVNSANLPTAYSLQGFPPNSIGDSRAVNALLQSNGGWTQYNDFTIVRSEDIHVSSTAFRISLNLDFTTGAGLGPMSPTNEPVYVFDGSVIRFREALLVDQGLSPITFEASMRTWIYCTADGVVRIDIVALATAATPGAGEFTVLGVDTDATDITMIQTVSSPAFELHFTGPNFIVETDFAVLGSAGIGNGLTIGGGGLAVSGVITAFGETATLVVDGDAVVNGDVDINGILDVDTADATSAAVVGTNSSTGPGLRGVSAGNAGVEGASASSAAGLVGTNSGTGPGVKGTGGTTAAGVEGVATVAAQPGVKGTGAAAAGSNGVTGVAVNTASYGVAGSASAAATTTGAGVRADGLGNAPALWAVAVDGHAALLTSDTSSPTRAALRITPQDSDPSSTGVGDVLINSSLLNKIRHHNGTAYLSVHSSAKGQVSAFANGTSGTTLNSGDLATVTIVAEQAGDVLLTATGLFEMAGDGDTCNILLRDVTLGTTLQTTVERQIDTDGIGVRSRSFVARFVYTLPLAGSRSFAFQITGNGAVNVTRSACVFSVIGVQ
jgi:hypothetical protein